MARGPRFRTRIAFQPGDELAVALNQDGGRGHVYGMLENIARLEAQGLNTIDD